MRKQLLAPVGEQKLMPNKKKIPKSNARGEPGSTLHKKQKKKLRNPERKRNSVRKEKTKQTSVYARKKKKNGLSLR